IDIRRRGLEIAPDLAIGDGALGFWKAIEEVFPGTRHQRCWVHKTANVLNKVALSVQVNMKADLREIYGASTRAAAEVAIDVFADKYGTKSEKAVACLTKDRDALVAFFDFPAEHWDHLRTSNPIESVFATVRHRTVRTKGSLSATTAKLMVFKLITAAAKTWRRLKGENQLPKVVQGVRFQNGIEVIEMTAHHAVCSTSSPNLLLSSDDEALGLIGALDDLDVHARQNVAKTVLEAGALISAIGIELQQKGIEAEQGGHEKHAAIAILDVRGMHDGMHQEALRIDENMPLLAFDLLARIVAMRFVRPPFSALFTLWLSMIGAVGEASRPALSRHST